MKDLILRSQSGRLDSNQRPLRPERSALPGCATARKKGNHFSRNDYPYFSVSGRLDSNQRPPAPHAGTLPGCATSRTTSQDDYHPPHSKENGRQI